MANYVREVDHDYQMVLDDKQVLIVTAEANYSLVYHKTHETAEEAIREYWHIKMGIAQGKTIFEACHIRSLDVSEHVRKWEAQRLAR